MKLFTLALFLSLTGLLLTGFYSSCLVLQILSAAGLGIGMGSFFYWLTKKTVP